MERTSSRLVSIIIVTCAEKDYLKSCLDSLKQQTCPAMEIIVIDNSLQRGFGQEIVGRYPEIKLYADSKNLFYCAALNAGINMSRGDFILCLNDDVTLDERFIQEALRGFGVDERIGMISGKILRSNGKTIDSTGLFLSPWRTAKERGYGLKDKGDYKEEEYIFGVNGAVAFYRRAMLEDIRIGPDYFDADFRMFYEDLDVAWRGQRFGWRAYYVPKAVAYHIRGGTARQACGIDKIYGRRYLNDDLHLDLIKNRYLALVKNESLSGFLLHLPFILIYDLLAWSYILFFKPAVIKRFFLNLQIIRSAFRKRRLIKKKLAKPGLFGIIDKLWRHKNPE